MCENCDFSRKTCSNLEIIGTKVVHFRLMNKLTRENKFPFGRKSNENLEKSLPFYDSTMAHVFGKGSRIEPLSETTNRLFSRKVCIFQLRAVENYCRELHAESKNAQNMQG
jgi:hypothetical protein